MCVCIKWKWKRFHLSRTFWKRRSMAIGGAVSGSVFCRLILLLLSLSPNSKDSSQLENKGHDGSRYYSIKLLSPGFIRTKISLRSLTFVKDSGEICNSDSLSDREQRFPSSLTHQNKDAWVLFNQADWYLFSTSILKKFETYGHAKFSSLSHWMSSYTS